MTPGKLIESVREFESLRIVDIDRSLRYYDKTYSELLASVAKYFVGAFAYTWHTYEPSDFPVLHDCPDIRHPGIKRPGEKFTNHERMGREYFSWFKVNHPNSEIAFFMAPDFAGRLLGYGEDIYFWGDFGRVSIPAIFDVLQDVRMKPGSLWITVPATGKHLILECQVNMAAFIQQMQSGTGYSGSVQLEAAA